MPRYLAALLFLPALSFAAPFLVSDPWPLTDLQPDACTYTEGVAQTPKPLTLNTNTADQKFVRHDLVGTPSGSHTLAIVCTNTLWGVASPPVNFQFAAGAPPAPAGLRLVP